MKKKGKKVIKKSVLKKKKQSQKTPATTKAHPHPKQKEKNISLKSRAKKSPVKKQKKVSLKIKKPKKRAFVQKTSLKTITKGPKQKKAIPLRKTIHKKSEEDRKATLRKTLIQKRQEIIKEAKAEITKYIKGETKQLVDTALDDGDWSIIDLSEDISLRRLSTHRETLLKIDEALRKFDEGTYGLCEDCGDEIQKERLRILPFAIYCRDCQEKKEQLEEAEKARDAGY